MRKPLLLLLVLLAGCGGDDEPTSTATPVQTTDSVTTVDTLTLPGDPGTVETTPAETTAQEEAQDSGGAAAPDDEETKTAEESGGSTAPTGQKRRSQPSAKREAPAAYFAPRAGTSQDTFTLYASGFRPGAMLVVFLSRPDGQNVGANGTIKTGSDGSGKLTLSKDETDMAGTYSATVKNTATGASATAELLVAG